jgi:hypothetical protein
MLFVHLDVSIKFLRGYRAHHKNPSFVTRRRFYKFGINLGVYSQKCAPENVKSYQFAIFIDIVRSTNQLVMKKIIELIFSVWLMLIGKMYVGKRIELQHRFVITILIQLIGFYFTHFSITSNRISMNAPFKPRS